MTPVTGRNHQCRQAAKRGKGTVISTSIDATAIASIQGSGRTATMVGRGWKSGYGQMPGQGTGSKNPVTLGGVQTVQEKEEGWMALVAATGQMAGGSERGHTTSETGGGRWSGPLIGRGGGG